MPALSTIEVTSSLLVTIDMHLLLALRALMSLRSSCHIFEAHRTLLTFFDLLDLFSGAAILCCTCGRLAMSCCDGQTRCGWNWIDEFLEGCDSLQLLAQVFHCGES